MVNTAILGAAAGCSTTLALVSALMVASSEESKQ